MSTPGGERLATIMEDNDKYIKSSPKSFASSKSRTTTLPRISADAKPPSYASQEHIYDIQNIKHNNHKRGGIIRFLLIIFMIILIIIGLSVGLGVGLKKKHSDNSNKNITKDDVEIYSFITALRSISRGCTTNDLTWKCPPYQINYGNPSSTDGLDIINLSLIKSNTTNTTSISTLTNPFNLSFNGTTKYNSQNDSLIYSTTNQEIKIIPSGSINDNENTSICYYNSTNIDINIYLSKEREYPSSTLNITGAGYKSWPYSFDMVISSNNGPDCYEYINGNVGSPITINSGQGGCSCEYNNYDF